MNNPTTALSDESGPESTEARSVALFPCTAPTGPCARGIISRKGNATHSLSGTAAHALDGQNQDTAQVRVLGEDAQGHCHLGQAAQLFRAPSRGDP